MSAARKAAVPRRAGTAELHCALEQVVSDYFGVRRRLVQLERRPSDYGSSFLLEELEVVLENGQRLSLMFKDVSPCAMLADARQVKPWFLCEPLREITAYREILGHAELGTATFYGAITEPRIGRFWILLERVPGVPLWQVGDFESWKQVARWLARAHHRLARLVPEGDELRSLLRYDGEFYRLWPSRALRLASAESRHEIKRIAARYDVVVERLLELPVTLIHGEFFPSNVLVQETASGLRICAIDWEMAGSGPGLLDLAALTGGNWTDEQKDALASSYYQELVAGGGCPLQQDIFRSGLDACRLHLCMQWLGWSRSWSPPPEHARNWLAEARELAERLGL